MAHIKDSQGYKNSHPIGNKTITASKVLNESRLTPRIWGLWLITGAGFALDGFDLFIIGIAMPLLMKQYAILGNLSLINERIFFMEVQLLA